jgi:hypothetical protein
LRVISGGQSEVSFIIIFFFLTNIALLKLGTKVPTIGKSKRGRLTFPLQMREEGGGGGNKWECSPKKLLLHYKWERKRRGGGGVEENKWECSLKKLLSRLKMSHGGRRS